jgi:hypothetical protein
MLIIARLLWALSSTPEKATKVVSIGELEKKIDEIRKALSA